MPTVTAVTNHFPDSKEGFSTTLSGSIASGATTVGLNSTTGYDNGDIVTLTVDPGDATKKQVFTGTVSGTNITNVVWTEGTNQAHSAGATVVDYVSSTHWNQAMKGVLAQHNQAGGHTAVTATSVATTGDITVGGNLAVTGSSVTVGGTNIGAGWTSLGTTLAFASSAGQKEFTMTAGASMDSTLTPGMRMKFTRDTTPPTQCADLESSSSQYASRASGSVTGITFTDDFTVEAWVKLESYPSAAVDAPILSRISASQGFWCGLNSAGQLILSGHNAAIGNYRRVLTNASVPLGRWVHIAATLDMGGFTSATCKAFFDGVDVPASLVQGGTNPASLVQAGDLQIGSYTAVGAGYFDGILADVRLWNAVRTQTQIRDNMMQTVAAGSTNLVGNWILNGNFNDATSNANNLTASGGATATTVDNPYKATEYAIITKVSGTTVTVFTGSEYSVPNMTLSSPAYSVHKVPQGFNADPEKWTVLYRWSTNPGNSGSIAGVWNTLPGTSVVVPTGAWRQDGSMKITGNSGTAATFILQTQWDSASPGFNRNSQHVARPPLSTNFHIESHRHGDKLNYAAATTLQLYAAMVSGSGAQVAYIEPNYPSVIYFECAYL